MNELVHRLSQGEHPVEVSIRPETTIARFQERINLGLVHIKFTNTQGGTELGVRLDSKTCDFSQADFNQATGTAHLVGHLTLNYVSVRCIANIDLSTLTGQGHLEPLADAVLSTVH